MRFDADLGSLAEEEPLLDDPRVRLLSRCEGGPGVRARGGGGRPRPGRSSSLSSSSSRRGASARAFPFPFAADACPDAEDAGAEALAPRLRASTDSGSSSLSTSSLIWGGVGGNGRSLSSSLNETRRPLERLRCPGGTDAGRRIGDELGDDEGIGEDGGSVPFEKPGSYEYG